jgi:hypothetical protein
MLLEDKPVGMLTETQKATACSSPKEPRWPRSSGGIWKEIALGDLKQLRDIASGPIHLRSETLGTSVMSGPSINRR